jgi:NitT/TauT family transport system substrate-binding protein
MNKKIAFQSVLAAALALWLAGCALGSQSTLQDTNLKMGLLPILDVLPFYIARDQGYFEAEGINVELVPVKSANERDALMQAGEIDGELTDLIATAIFNREDSLIKVVSKARKAYPDFPQFRILAAPGVDVAGPDDLAGVPIGISQNTVIEYTTDRLLAEWGLPPDQMAIEEVSAIPTRFELLMQGQLQAANLPDPLAQGAIAAGATLVVDDAAIPQYSQSVLAFSTAALESKPDTVRAFMRAWNKAVDDLNQDPNAYRGVLAENTAMPASIEGTYNIPNFPKGEITSEEEWNDVIEWAQEKGLVDSPIPHQQVVDTSYLK